MFDDRQASAGELPCRWPRAVRAARRLRTGCRSSRRLPALRRFVGDRQAVLWTARGITGCCRTRRASCYLPSRRTTVDRWLGSSHQQHGQSTGRSHSSLRRSVSGGNPLTGISLVHARPAYQRSAKADFANASGDSGSLRLRGPGGPLRTETFDDRQWLLSIGREPSPATICFPISRQTATGRFPATFGNLPAYLIGEKEAGFRNTLSWCTR